MRAFAQKPKTNQSNIKSASSNLGWTHSRPTRHAAHNLQRMIGNQAVLSGSQMLPGIQAKLTISTPGDRYEQEAEHAANTVMAGRNLHLGQVSQGIQRKLHRMEIRPEDMVDSMPPIEGEAIVAPLEEIQRSASKETATVSSSFEQSLQQATQSGGATLPSPTRTMMENRFGWDFSSVKVHSDTRAHTLAQQANAHAFTLGSDIFFARSQYQPDSPKGQHLLAHELTHVVQQSDGRLSRQIQRRTSCSSYPGYNASVPISGYNCAGLATRTYRDIYPPSAVYDAIEANFIGPVCPLESCDPGNVKFWMWEYNIHLEDDLGRTLSRNRSDFHIVAGRTSVTGANPTDVYSKNGHRPIYGPNTGPSFRPSTRERATSNNASETPATYQGRPVYKVRSNMTEEVTCAECYL